MGGISRNSPCPCGSGKKYKHCHLQKDEEEVVAARGIRLGPAVVGLVLGVAAGVAAGVYKSPTVGFALGSGVFVLSLIAAAIISPPPPGQGGDPGAINFGTTKK